MAGAGSSCTCSPACCRSSSGFCFCRAPVGALAALTLLIACFLMVGGIFKTVAALGYRFAAWGWPLAGGIIDLILGVLIWQEWPASALWVIGLFVGINLLFRGFNWIALGMALCATSPGDAMRSAAESHNDHAKRASRHTGLGRLVGALLRAQGEPSEGSESKQRRSGIVIAALLLAVLALLAPLGRAQVHGRVGLLLVLAAAPYLRTVCVVRRCVGSGRRGSAAPSRWAWACCSSTRRTSRSRCFGSSWPGRSLWTALAICSTPSRLRKGRISLLGILACLGNFVAALVIFALRGRAAAWTLAAAGAVRILGTAWNIFVSPVYTASDTGDTVMGDLALADNPEMAALARRIALDEAARAPIDRGWILGFLATLLAIHMGRMGFDRSFLGIIAPGFAVLGDLMMALLLAFVVVIPVSVLWRRLTRGPERWMWEWCLKVPEGRRGWVRRAVRAAMIRRLRFSIRLRRARYSFRTALSRGLQIGLPLSAIIAATVPVWGMSWYFDTENWAAGIWNSWAEERTDSWREAMVRAMSSRRTATSRGLTLAITPERVPRNERLLLYRHRRHR